MPIHRTKPADIVGRKFGLLTVVGVGAMVGGKTGMLCRCDCGSETTATVGHLVGGRRLTCGCSVGKSNLRHGLRYSRAYGIWSDMIRRCENPSHVSYRYYGAKGVSVCERWRESFAAFVDDMGQPPDGLSIDRIDGNVGYEPGNCRWATPQEQTENRSIQRFYVKDGRVMTLPKWAVELGLPYRTLLKQVRSGRRADIVEQVR